MSHIPPIQSVPPLGSDPSQDAAYFAGAMYSVWTDIQTGCLNNLFEGNESTERDLFAKLSYAYRLAESSPNIPPDAKAAVEKLMKGMQAYISDAKNPGDPTAIFSNDAYAAYVASGVKQALMPTVSPVDVASGAVMRILLSATQWVQWGLSAPNYTAFYEHLQTDLNNAGVQASDFTSSAAWNTYVTDSTQLSNLLAEPDNIPSYYNPSVGLGILQASESALSELFNNTTPPT